MLWTLLHLISYNVYIIPIFIFLFLRTCEAYKQCNLLSSQLNSPVQGIIFKIIFLLRLGLAVTQLLKVFFCWLSVFIWLLALGWRIIPIPLRWTKCFISCNVQQLLKKVHSAPSNGGVLLFAVCPHWLWASKVGWVFSKAAEMSLAPYPQACPCSTQIKWKCSE